MCGVKGAAAPFASWWVAVLACALGLAGCAGTPDVPPQAGDFTGWQDFKLPGKQPTLYEPMQLDGAWVVRARSSSAASMFRRQLRIEPAQLSQLSFDWQVDQLIDRADLSDSERADSPVRLVLAFDGDRARLSAKNRLMYEFAEAVTGEPPPYATLMYVWDNQAALESVLPGGRSDRIRKIVVESGPGQLGRWCSHRRDIAADFRRAFGEEPGALIGVALLSDTDNTRSTAQALYRRVVVRDADGQPR